jgi:hypothetical protein
MGMSGRALRIDGVDIPLTERERERLDQWALLQERDAVLAVRWLLREIIGSPASRADSWRLVVEPSAPQSPRKGA